MGKSESEHTQNRYALICTYRLESGVEVKMTIPLEVLEGGEEELHANEIKIWQDIMPKIRSDLRRLTLEAGRDSPQGR